MGRWRPYITHRHNIHPSQGLWLYGRRSRVDRLYRAAPTARRFHELLMNRGNFSTHVLFERLGFKMRCFASSGEVVQGAINLCRLKMSISAVLYKLAGFIANTEKMQIEIGPAFREADGRNRIVPRIELHIAGRCEKNFHGCVRRPLTPALSGRAHRFRTRRASTMSSARSAR
jgi:hypothetical protein